jgi:hypothetical protein
MEVFAFNPAAGNEPISDFNGRLKAYSLENSILDVQVTTVDQAIVVSLTTADDDGSVSPILLVPVVVPLTTSDFLALETKLSQVRDDLLAQDSDDNPFVPFQVKVYPAAGVAYAVFLVAAGFIEEDPDAPGEGDPP